MDEAPRQRRAMGDQDERISDAVRQERTRLLRFIRRTVPDPQDAEDILQDVFHKLVEAYRMADPVEQVTAWLFRVARNRIIDLFRERQRQPRRAALSTTGDEEGPASPLDLVPSADAGPEAAYARKRLVEELAEALGELPEEQRDVFVAHELMGRSFKELAAETGVSVNTLLSRKHYAVLYLRRRLRDIHDEFIESGDRP